MGKHVVLTEPINKNIFKEYLNNSVMHNFKSKVTKMAQFDPIVESTKDENDPNLESTREKDSRSNLELNTDSKANNIIIESEKSNLSSTQIDSENNLPRNVMENTDSNSNYSSSALGSDEKQKKHLKSIQKDIIEYISKVISLSFSIIRYFKLILKTSIECDLENTRNR